MSQVIYIAAFTHKGIDLAKALGRELADQSFIVQTFAPKRLESAEVLPMESLGSWTEKAFETANALIFVSATGIAVRAIAPYLKDKMKDPAVVSVDEAGRYVIPLVSGHVGGANELARTIAGISGGVAAVSTATDVNGIFAVDEWAARNGLTIVERTRAKKISAALLEGGQVGFASDFPVSGDLPEGLSQSQGDCEIGILVSGNARRNPFSETLHLVPKIIAAGVGCKKDAPFQTLQETADESLKSLGLSPSSVRILASIDVKRNESAIHALSQLHDWNLAFYSADQLNAVEGTFEESEFVRNTVGVGNVCERSAIKAVTQIIDGQKIDAKPQIILGKHANSGTTFALACAVPALAFPSTKTMNQRR